MIKNTNMRINKETKEQNTFESETNTLYHLYRNTFDNTYVIVIDNLRDLLVRTLTNMGSAPNFISTSNSLSDLQIKTIVEFSQEGVILKSLN
jgi:hypothetical protein